MVWNRKSELDLHRYGQLIFPERCQDNTMVWIIFSTNDPGITGYTHTKGKKLQSLSHTIYKYLLGMYQVNLLSKCKLKL